MTSTAASESNLWAEVTAALSTENDLNLGLVDRLQATIEQSNGLQSIDLQSMLSDSSPWHDSLSGTWLSAKLLELQGKAADSLKVWQQLIEGKQLSFSQVIEALLNRARLAQALGDMELAANDIRRIADTSHEYSDWTKAAKILTKLLRKKQSVDLPYLRSAKIAVLSTSTPDLLVPLIQLACFRDGINAQLYVAPYGSAQQEVLNPGSGLYAFQPSFVINLLNWRDANLTDFDQQPEITTDGVLNDLTAFWNQLTSQQACHIIQANFDLPAIDPNGYLSKSLPAGRASILNKINLRLFENTPAAVSILDLDGISANYGKQRWSDAKYWHLAKQHPATGALPLLANNITALIRNKVGLTKKVLVLDLDNTLWGGVIGEEGINHIELGAPSARGEAFQAFQSYLRSLKERGILLAVCSKNNQEDAQQPFLEHDSSILKLEDFAIFVANWQDKASNIRQIAETLSLGLDSFVFIDDNPIERELVKKELPEVAVPEMPPEPSDYIQIIDQQLYFQSTSLSAEDIDRHQSYQAKAKIESLKTSSASIEEFLTGLQMTAEVGEFNDSVLSRVVQLIGKTNQFNLTTPRYTEEQVVKMINSPDYWTQYIKLKDKYTDHGIIGLNIAKKQTDNQWEIDTWLMSCRVIGRSVENLMLDLLVKNLQHKGCTKLYGSYIPTRKNAMVADLYKKLGFQSDDNIGLATSNPDGSSYILKFNDIILPINQYIKYE
jgi:FkbH-like protein